MDSELFKFLDEIEKDCLKLQKNNELTEYGQGQLDLIRMIRALYK